MNKIKYELKRLERPEYIEDTKRITKVAFNNGVSLTIKEAEEVWLEYSDSMAAGWMGLPKKDSELWQILMGEMI